MNSVRCAFDQKCGVSIKRGKNRLQINKEHDKQM
jgi:hypothetical protein